MRKVFGQGSQERMNAAFSPEGKLTNEPILVGALAPLTRPGWTEAGRHLLAGMDLAVSELNAAGGINGSPLDLVVCDTAADPQKAAAAVKELVDLGVVAVIGEYHSVVAQNVAARADELAVPFLCSSAVIDTLLERPSQWVARLAPVQSKGWKIYADFLLSIGHSHIAVATAPSVYWASGISVLRERLAQRGGSLIEIDAQSLTSASVCDELISSRATALLLLVGYPDPAVSIARAVRSRPRLAHVMIGAPAGQPEFNEWLALSQSSGAEIPFLRYMPRMLGPLGNHVQNVVRERLAEEPSFVALEGYDTATVIADILRLCGSDRNCIAEVWPHVVTAGTRGEIRFTRSPGVNVWQWVEAPIQVVERERTNQTKFRILYTGQD